MRITLYRTNSSNMDFQLCIYALQVQLIILLYLLTVVINHLFKKSSNQKKKEISKPILKSKPIFLAYLW